MRDQSLLPGLAVRPFSLLLGAALLGSVGAGSWPSVEAACDATIAVTGRDEPVAEWAEAYEALYPRYRELYGALKPTYDALPG